ncbi:MAG: hypothetical protein AVDCRST_MAG56-5610 [uncultured Cytophagales bacterium]|uniref:Uncharacterized protein n=1 Tax=uncultured Cytophagales bacterium TaxID=158755 RepID=A0A6J4KDY6_9SPHI|nr:MAG: hypothetical protein AVDCRST_MAG56-5610 [uncultured Cytophagales bacterium]
MVSRRVGPAQWRGAGCLAGGSIIGPRLFWFFLGQCQKEQTLLTHHLTHPQPFTIPLQTILLQTTQPITNPSPTPSPSNTPMRQSHTPLTAPKGILRSPMD